jgi:transcriptional regulator with XRE-family HTH domain
MKVFYLRTRERNLSQQAVADAMGVRQATLSNIERGQSMPSAALLVELCKFYDVTPTFLLDEERGVVPVTSERWSLRDALATVGMWVEASRDALVELPDGKVLCPLESGEEFYDEDARRVRQSNGHPAGRAEMDAHLDARREQETALEQVLERELRTHPRRRGRAEEPADVQGDGMGPRPAL